MKVKELKQLDRMQGYYLAGMILVSKKTNKALIIVTDNDGDLEGLPVSALKEGKVVTTKAYYSLGELVLNELVLNDYDELADNNDWRDVLDEADDDIAKVENINEALANIKVISNKDTSELFKNLGSLLENKIK